jgi:AP-1-like factor
MDYSYFGVQQQPYHFLGMSSDSFPRGGVDSETTKSVVSSSKCWSGVWPRTFSLVDRTMTNQNTTQEPLDPSIFPTSYDAFAFHGLPTPHQGSPDALVLTPMPVGSVDSGLGGDMDDGRGHTRSSSEEKESLTPAQSRRKAQNRAAYVPSAGVSSGLSANRATDSAHSASVKNGT